MDMMRPITTRIGELAQRHAYHAMVGRAGHGIRQATGIINYSGPSESQMVSAGHYAVGMAKRGISHAIGGEGGGGGAGGYAPAGAKGGGGGGFLGAVGNVVGKVGGIIGGIENGIGTALRIGKAVAPYLPLAAAVL
jgi:hypothetical protein